MKRQFVLIFLAFGCTETGLYDAKNPPIEANRVALKGVVCTEDPEIAKFPVRLVIVADQAGGPLYSSFDPSGERIKALTELVRQALTRPHYEVAVVGYGARVTKLAPKEGAFGRNPAELYGAIDRLAVPVPCAEEGYCRDYGEGLRVARNIIEDDLTSKLAGERGLTQYVVVLMNAGPMEPMAKRRACCARGDANCRNGGDADMSSFACQKDLDSRNVSEMRDSILASGASNFELHVMHLQAADDMTVDEAVADTHATMAFDGGGRFDRAGNIAALDLKRLRIFDRRNTLQVKHLIVSNRNAGLKDGVMRADSDGDGLTDEDEVDSGTDPLRKDTDDDGVSDLVELLASLDPLAASTPEACAPELSESAEGEGLLFGQLAVKDDYDRDGLTNCEELILGLDPSIVDTDGDGAPDGMEVRFGTDYLNRDDVDDGDGDGVANGDEVREHTDPRITDLPARLGAAYRYTVNDLGLSREGAAEGPEKIPGVRITGVSRRSTPGVGRLLYTADPPSLAWQDPVEDEPGPTVPIADAQGGVLELPAKSFREEARSDGRILRVKLRPSLLPPTDVTDDVRIVFRERHCLEYVVRNIRLLETLTNVNHLYLYFAEAPESDVEAPGPFRIAQVPIEFIPPASRTPDGAMLTIQDDEFVHYPRRD
ncbi:MAG: hypothetical protein VX589_12980 [Myxococcota bacterium]|nr:hypothetical protein [Myxococcota bacterium]